MVRVCDAIMGSGKSQSAISYMNERPARKFVYITPYLDEAERIARSCPALRFVQPSGTLPSCGFSKLEHTRLLLDAGENIATTHAAFRAYTDDMAASIARHGYTLIVDEAVDVFREAHYSDGDISLLLEGGYLRCENGVYLPADKAYTGNRFRDLFEMFRCGNLIPVERPSGSRQFFYWAVPCDILRAFSDVFILTYLFESSDFRRFLDVCGIAYQHIGIRREDGVYRFSPSADYVPPYVAELRHRVQIYEGKLNRIGDKPTALSMNWMGAHREQRAQLKNHLYNYMRNIRHAPGSRILWTTYKRYEAELRGRGFYRGFLECNRKASNAFRERDTLAYCVNLYANPRKVDFFAQYGIDCDSDGYALSTMLQWIWRSAIRDGGEIGIYIPSSRMRALFQAWLEDPVPSGVGCPKK